MAYVNQQLPEKDKNQFGNTSQTTPNPIPPQTSGGSAGTASGGQGQGGVAPGVASSTQFGSNAAKLSDYLNANKEQVGAFGQKVAGNLTDQYNQAKGSIDTGYGNFGQDVSKGYTPYNEKLINDAASNPTEFVKNPENVSSFKSQFNDEYKGPQDFQSYQPYSDISNNVNKAVENANLVGSESGLKSYLGNYMNTGQNTPGMQTLDTLLLQRDPGARSNIQEAAKPFQNLTGYLGDKTNAANQSVANAKTQADQAKQTAQNKFTGEGGAIPSFESDLTNRLAQTRTDQGALADKAIQDYASGNLTPEEAKILGFDLSNMDDQALSKTGQFGQNLKQDYGVDTDWNALFTKQNPETIYQSPGSVASPEDLQKAQALSQLTGQDLSGYLGNTGPTGQMVNTSREGLSQLRQNLSDRDSQQLLKYANLFGWDGSAEAPTPTVSQFLQEINKDPRMMKAIHDTAQKAGDTTTLNAINRLYGNTSGLADPWSATNPEYLGRPSGGGRMGMGTGEHLGQWFNGTAWVTPPVEFKGSGDSRQRFDYTTGQYVSAPDNAGVFHIS